MSASASASVSASDRIRLFHLPIVWHIVTVLAFDVYGFKLQCALKHHGLISESRYSEFQLHSNLRVAFASARNHVRMYSCQQNQRENRSTRDSVRKRTQHGDSNATEIRCSYTTGRFCVNYNRLWAQAPCLASHHVLC